MVKEIIITNNGEEREVQVIQVLSLEVKYGALDAATKTNVNIKTKDSNVEVNMGALILYVIKHQVTGANASEIDAKYGEAIFNKYFARYFEESEDEEGKPILKEGDASNPPTSVEKSRDS